MFMTCHVKISINISEYGNTLACEAIYSQNLVLKTFLILNDIIAALFGRLWFDPAIQKQTIFTFLPRLTCCRYVDSNIFRFEKRQNGKQNTQWKYAITLAAPQAKKTQLQLTWKGGTLLTIKVINLSLLEH